MKKPDQDKSESLPPSQQDILEAEQNRTLSGHLAHLLEDLDAMYSENFTSIPTRITLSCNDLLSFGLVEIKAGDTILVDPSQIAKSMHHIGYRRLWEAVRHWYENKYGALVLEPAQTPHTGIIFIHGMPFELRVPQCRSEVAEEGETAWLYFAEDIHETEDPLDWLHNSPSSDNFGPEIAAELRANAKRVAGTLRYVAFRRGIDKSVSHSKADELVEATLFYLCDAAKKIASHSPALHGPAWNDLQLAAESALKAVALMKTGQQRFSHDLPKLLLDAHIPLEDFNPLRLNGWPRFSHDRKDGRSDNISTWRLLQGAPPGLEALQSAYETTIDLTRAAMKQIPPAFPSGFGLLIRYAPWRTRDALGNIRPIETE